MIQKHCTSMLLVATLTSCVSWTSVERPTSIQPLGPADAAAGWHVISAPDDGRADALVEELREVTKITSWDRSSDVKTYFYGTPSDLELVGASDIPPVTVPTLRIACANGPMTAVPPYALTFFTLGIVPTKTPHVEKVVALLCLPGRPPRLMTWAVHEDLFAWLPLLPITPFWAAWRETSAGEVGSPLPLAARDLRALLRRTGGDS